MPSVAWSDRKGDCDRKQIREAKKRTCLAWTFFFCGNSEIPKSTLLSDYRIWGIIFWRDLLSVTAGLFCFEVKHCRWCTAAFFGCSGVMGGIMPLCSMRVLCLGRVQRPDLPNMSRWHQRSFLRFADYTINGSKLEGSNRSNCWSFFFVLKFGSPILTHVTTRTEVWMHKCCRVQALPRHRTLLGNGWTTQQHLSIITLHKLVSHSSGLSSKWDDIWWYYTQLTFMWFGITYGYVWKWCTPLIIAI